MTGWVAFGIVALFMSCGFVAYVGWRVDWDRLMRESFEIDWDRETPWTPPLER